MDDLLLPFLKINGELGKVPKSAILAANCHFIHNVIDHNRQHLSFINIWALKFLDLTLLL